MSGAQEVGEGGGNAKTFNHIVWVDRHVHMTCALDLETGMRGAM